ncbi:hypothetical protein [Streptomyces iranensis]|uniref:Uncharacterized protein YndB with AHSA1/START domain n=1 Tax=Streptomyces iranensis TaxID=576784 RepID=A0A061AD80_9ACTN|nr:hypothetical protein [Streptomyces iranensis]MBP2063564.1 uncharacterized protein YndB with AHSA1/START domain [Streptomyces iranensis]CDR17852.1 predicted protein [Streptomyces iranensis]
MHWTLERLLPAFDKREHHSRRIDAPPERVWRGLVDLRVGELAVTLGLMRVRGGPRTWTGGVDPGAHQGVDPRVLEWLPPREMAADPPHEVVLGDIARYTALRPVRPDVERGDPEAFAHFDEAGWSKVVMNFRLTPEGDGTWLSTETRVLNTDPATRRAFALYWGFIRAGSGMIRRDVLRAIAKKVAGGGL